MYYRITSSGCPHFVYRSLSIYFQANDQGNKFHRVIFRQHQNCFDRCYDKVILAFYWQPALQENLEKKLVGCLET